MKSMLILANEDFVRDQRGKLNPSLSLLKPQIKKEEINYDVVGYLEEEKIIIFKNRFGPIDSVSSISDLENIFLSKYDEYLYSRA